MFNVKTNKGIKTAKLDRELFFQSQKETLKFQAMLLIL